MIRNSFQCVDAVVLERNTGSDDEILDRTRDKYLTGARQVSNARCDMNAESADVISAPLDLPGVQAGPDLDPEATHRISDRACARDGACGAVEGGDHAVACVLHRGAAIALELPSNGAVVPVERRAPRAIAQPGGGGSRAQAASRGPT